MEQARNERCGGLPSDSLERGRIAKYGIAARESGHIDRIALDEQRCQQRR